MPKVRTKARWSAAQKAARKPAQRKRSSSGDREGFSDTRRGPQRSTAHGPRTDEPRETRRSGSKHPAAEPTHQAGHTRTFADPAPHEPVEVAGFAELGLPEPLLRKLSEIGIEAPFPIQAATIPDALSGRDVLGRGQTGSGKTLAFGLPLLARLAGRRSKPHQPRGLVLVPTRELAMQVADALAPLVHAAGLRHKLVAGGMPYGPQLHALDRGVDLLIATPGRMIDLAERKAAQLSSIEIVVLDEADHMAEMGFLPEVTTLLDQVPAGGQRLLFSATLDRGVDGLVANYLTDPVTHSTDPGSASVTTMEHHILLVDPKHKKPITAELANRPGRTLVFVRTKLGADRVAEQLRADGVVAAALHGGLGQGQRNRVLAAFKGGRVPVLVATDVAARGIHVDDVGLVLQADPPADHKDYLHRSGRTARAGDRGVVITLALPHQRATMTRLARAAGVEVRPVRTEPGNTTLLRVTGSSAPSGSPVAAADFERLVAGERKPKRAGGKPRRPTRAVRGPERTPGIRRSGESR